MYDGPKARLVLYNRMIACVALVPTLLYSMALLSEPASKVFGDVAKLGALPLLALIVIMQIPHVAVFLFVPLLLACIFLRRLLRSQEIPLPVKNATTLLVMGALLVMFVTFGLLYRAYGPGRLGHF